jgi:N-methylhydantoinase B
MSVSVESLVAGLPVVRDRAFWDGVRRSYIPGGEVESDPSLRLHRAVAESIDPVTYEVVRYSLLNINLEHTALIQKLAVSQIVILARDYQTAMMTEDGEMLLVGPCIQFFANSAEQCVKYILERRSGNPGIAPGDMFITNDAFVGSSHANDTTLAAPVFVGDELFCWVTNTLHYQDIGGTSPGSLCHDAVDAWDEPLHWPPVKIVEGGEMRDDIERLWVRQSRIPVMVGMDLRAAIAANEVARGQLGQLVERYGADVVKGVMRGMQDAGERLFVERLRSIPDGRWSHRFYSEGALPGDKNIYSLQVNITKVDDRLIADNRGTDPQVGSINMTFSGFAGSVLAGIVGQITPDVSGAYGGPYRRVEFRLEPATILSAEHPAAVSTGVYSMQILINAVSIAVAKMLSCGDSETRALALGPTYTHPGGTLAITGVDRDGNRWFNGAGEQMLGSFGGSPSRDGMDFGGHFWMPGGIGANVEDVEASNRVLYLYRRPLAAGLDGAGRHRGGLGVIFALCPRVEQATIGFATGEAFPKGAGVMGSEPGSRARVLVVRGTDVADLMARSQIPRSTEDLRGERGELPWKTMNTPVASGDVIEGVFPNVAGYGDPVQRAPAAVLADVRERILDSSVARRVYGVVISDDGIDWDATRVQRIAIRRERLGGRETADAVAPPEGAVRVGEILHVVDGRWWCNGADLGPSDENYKDHAVMLETPISEIGEEFATPFASVADQIVFREYICPITGDRIDTELSLRSQASLHDIHILTNP